MKEKHLITLCLLLLSVLFIAAPIDYQLVGTDLSNLRCSGGLISRGDLRRDVLKKCGEPMRETYVPNEPYRVFIYRFSRSQYLNYVSFVHSRVQRILQVRCWSDNPDCE